MTFSCKFRILKYIFNSSCGFSMFSLKKISFRVEITEKKKFIHIDSWFAGFMNFLVENILLLNCLSPYKFLLSNFLLNILEWNFSVVLNHLKKNVFVTHIQLLFAYDINHSISQENNVWRSEGKLNVRV